MVIVYISYKLARLMSHITPPPPSLVWLNCKLQYSSSSFRLIFRRSASILTIYPPLIIKLASLLIIRFEGEIYWRAF